MDRCINLHCALSKLGCTGVFLGLGEDTQRLSKGEKCTTKAIFGENFL